MRAVFVSSLILLVLLDPIPVARAAEDIASSHLGLSDCPQEPGCPAMVIFEEHELKHSSMRSSLRVRAARKIFTEMGVTLHADVILPVSTRFWYATGIRGRTLLPDGSSIRLGKNHIVEKEIRALGRAGKTTTLTFPGVVPGSTIEYSYEMVSKLATILPAITWTPQQAIPVLESVFLVEQGDIPVDWSRTGPKITHMERGGDAFHREFRVRNVPSIPIEPLGMSRAANTPHYYFYVSRFSSHWMDELAAEQADSAKRFMQPNPTLSDLVTSLVAASDSGLKKADKILRFVQHNIAKQSEALQVEDGQESDPAEDAAEVLARGYGTYTERTLLFLALVQEAGLPAGLLLIKSRSRGALNEKAPDPDQFDTTAAAVQTQEGWTFHDPGTRHSPFGMVSADKEAGQFNAILIRPGATVQLGPTARVRIPYSPASKNVLLRKADARFDPKGLTATVTDEGSGLVDLDHRVLYEGLKPEDRITALREDISRRIPGAELLQSAFDGIESFDRPARITYDISIPWAGMLADDRLIVMPSFLDAAAPAMLAAIDRETPVDFQHTISEQTTIVLEIPDGFTTDTLPPPVTIEDPPLTFRMRISDDGRSLRLQRLLIIDAPVWLPNEYEDLRLFLAKVREADNQPVVLRRSDRQGADPTPGP